MHAVRRRVVQTGSTVCPCRFVSSSSSSSSHAHPLPASIRSTLASAKADEPVTIHGWVKSCRRQKHVAFAVINDGSSVHGVQAVLKNGLDQSLTVGCSARLTGTFVDSPGRGQVKEFRAESVELLGSSDAETYPVPNTKQGIPLPLLRHHAHLRPRAPGPASMLRVRSEMAWAMAEHFRSEDFVRIEAPLITSSDCEGAGEVFRVESGATPPPPPPPIDESALPLSAAPRTPPPSSPRYLTVSSQLHLEAMSASLNRVYTLSPAFRAEKSDTARHLQEFWMLEAEVGFLEADESTALGQVMSVAERNIRHIVKHVLNLPEIDYFKSQSPGLAAQLESLSAERPYARMTYTQAVDILSAQVSSRPNAFTHPVKWGLGLQTEHEKWLAEEHVSGPVFVTDYPTRLKPFYMLKNPSTAPVGASGVESTFEPDRQTTACFDLLVPRLGELIGGSLREYREEPLREAMRAQGIREQDYEWYLDLRRYGSTRHGGYGLGWERLVACLTGLDNVRDCIAFPRATEGSRF